MRRLCTVTTDDGEKLHLFLKRDDDDKTTTWTLDKIATEFGYKPDMETRPENYLIQKTLYEKLSKLGDFLKTMRFWENITANDYSDVTGWHVHNFKHGDFCYHMKDHYVFRVMTAERVWLSSSTNPLINPAYCRYATAEEIQTYFKESLNKKKLPMNKKQFRRVLESVANIIEYKGNDRYEIFDKFLNQYED